MTLLFWIINLATVAMVYVLWIRPILQRTPGIKELYDREASYFSAFSVKFAGIKQRLTASFIYLAGVVVAMHDYFAPKLTGVSVAPLFPKLMAAVPNEAWPLIVICLTGLLDFFRWLADKRQE